MSSLLTKGKVLAVAALVLTGCIKRAEPASSLKEGEDPGKAAWLEKVVQTLRNGEPLGPNDDVDALLAMSRPEIVEKLMKDNRFGDTVLSFNLFYLGRSVNKLKSKDNSTGNYVYDPMVMAVPQALASAKAVLEGGDYYEIFGPNPTLIVPGLGKPQDPELEDGLPDADKRAKLLERIKKQVEVRVAAFGPTETEAALNKDSGCSEMYQLGYQTGQALRNAGFDNSVVQSVNGIWLAPLNNYPGLCYDQAVTAEQVIAYVKTFEKGVETLFTAAAALNASGKITTLADMQRLPLTTEGLEPLVKPFTVEAFWTPLRNSSTNFNRKRSAYMLRTYFCDDLTPLNVEVPATHGNDAHASDPACLACHYKLDPMGGLFRYNGNQGTNFEKAKNFTFDDFAQLGETEFADYLKKWQTEDGKWKTGYYVALNKPHSKWKGDKLEDIWPFLRIAPEAKACLVRRMAEYFLGPNQVYDGLWLEEISKNLKAGPSSSNEFKQVVSSLVLSKTFANTNPEPGKCYDFSSDDEGGERPPCEIGAIVKKRCATCHNDADSFGVDFTKWQKLEDGTYGFLHLDEAREKQISRIDSFKSIVARITSADPAFRMPQGGSMSEMERQVLYKWLDKQINP